MITPTKAYQTSDGKTHPTLDAAKTAELEIALLKPGQTCITAADIVAQAEKVVDILTTGPESRPRARRVNGGRKPRKPKVETPEVPKTE